ncbi:heme-dependent oxidative N-demethylase family protein [Rhizobium sp. SL42]|uniref:heme-dependent oxidative N-demethylase family protein n=1 Tax=Rhizobium sp. SL42 TaxID=2806346 RepID=UPI001F3BFC8A|nr:DUF3445 domain-containing protein [Rhizobium sp. SL42]UJW74625.1 DUF3445 domain-containing protein [Rhizobium sp. SL42]
MTAFVHTPYATASRPFTIGLSSLDPTRWITPDNDLTHYLDEKRRLATTRRDDIFRATADSLPTQHECLGLIVDHLETHHPHLCRREGNTFHIGGHKIDLEDETVPPLMRAGFLVQDDLVIMKRREAGWYMAAAHLSFPSSWSLAEKFDRPMEQIHAHVPGFQDGTRNAAMINRIFDNLLADQPAERFNWSINWRQKLHHPETGRNDAATPDEAVIRVERQTLTKLPGTGDIVFTIRIYLDPVAVFENHPEGARLASALAEQLDALTPEQAAYKGVDVQRRRLGNYLRDRHFAKNSA